MKYKKIIISLVVICVFMPACEKEWLDREPLDQVTEAAFFNRPGDFTVFVNRFHPSTGGTFSMGDHHTDVHISSNTIPTRIAGESTINDGPSYDYSDIRRVNYLLQQIRAWEGDFEEIRQAAGEAHYFRAWYHWVLLRNFGDVHWIDKVLTMDSEELFSPRDPRNIVADNIIADLDTAAMYLMTDRGDGYSRLPRWFALLLQSRVALFEGTWQKYHANSAFGANDPDPGKYLNKSIAASQEIMNSGLYSLHSTGDPLNDYYNTFNWRDFTSNPEVMRWTKMDLSQDINAGRKLFFFAFPENNGLTKELIDQYLCIDGLPKAISPLYQGDNTIEDELQNRDPRFDQTVFTQENPLYIYEDGSIDYYSVTFARFFQDISHSNSTGYQQRKHYNAHRIYHHTQHEETPTLNDRYAEVLLNFAEARAETATLTQDDLDISINLLRDRVGMPHLVLADIVADPEWRFPDLSPVINEIRRERLIELVSENFRMNDLFRWSAMKYVNGSRGIGAKAEQFLHDPGMPVTADGYLDVHQNALPDGYQFNLGRDYLWPIPEGQIRLNPQIGQNPGWGE
jgi:starch-binding outer membrane protein, SusD/RagB family